MLEEAQPDVTKQSDADVSFFIHYKKKFFCLLHV